MKLEDLSPEQKRMLLEKLQQKETIGQSIANSAPGQTTEYRRLESWIDGWISGALIMLEGKEYLLTLAEIKAKLER